MILYPESQIIITKKGKFHLKLTSYMHRNTGIIESYNINLGGINDKCIQIKVPSPESGKTDADLMWVKSADSCSMEKYSSDGFTQHMVLLGITIARKINQSLAKVTLLDTSSFTCTLPNRKETVPMKPFHIAFHGDTWYEHYFNAKLEKNHNEYVRLKDNLYHPDMKPPTFNFMNDDLQDELEPLFYATDTWADFFSAIELKYKKKKCAVVYPWLTAALHTIFDIPYFESPKWYIDLNDTSIKNISFKSYHAIKGGTRKKRAENITYLFPDRSTPLKYAAFLQHKVAST
jgi:hypothetical protein